MLVADAALLGFGLEPEPDADVELVVGKVIVIDVETPDVYTVVAVIGMLVVMGMTLMLPESLAVPLIRMPASQR